MNNIIQSINNYVQSWPLIFKVLALGIVAFLLFSFFRRKPQKAEKQITQWDTTDYQSNILDSLPDDVRVDYTHLYESIGEIYNMAYRYQNSLEAQKVETADLIQRKINESSTQIERKWRQLQGKKDFYRYIGLHYASFTLADSIKKEQEILRDAFVSAKRECDKLSAEINTLNNAIPNSHGQRKYELMQQHKSLCARHKRISQMKGIFGSRNTQYLNQVKAQNKITMEYREYIIHNFGQKGRAWGKRLQKRKLDQIS